MIQHITLKRIAIIAGLLLLCLLIFMPLRVALGLSGLEQRGVSARTVEGAIWAGQLGDLHIGNLPLGNVDARLRPLPLLTGKTEMALHRAQNGQSPALNAIVGSRGDMLTVRSASADIATRGVFAPVPVSSIQLENVNAEIHGGKCVEARGTVRVNVQQGLPGLNLSRGLSGKIACRNGALFVPLVGQSGLEKLELTIREGGRYEAVFIIDDISPELAAPLGGLGFSTTGNSLRLVATGQF